MNIHLHSISQSDSWFKTQVNSLTDQQKKIFVVAAFALSCLALCYYAFKRFKAKSIELQREYPVRTWDFRLDSTYQRSLKSNYNWVKKNVLDFMKKADEALIIEVTKFAYAKIPPYGVDPNSLLHIGDLIICAQTPEQTKAIVTTVANSKKHVRTIFSTLFLQMSNETHKTVTEDTLQQVVSNLSKVQLMNVLALDNNKYPYFYQKENIEIRGIEVDNYIKYQHVLNLPPEFITKCQEFSQYAKYIDVKAKKAEEVTVLIDDCLE